MPLDFVDEQDGMRIVLQGLQDAFEALLEVTTVFGPGEQGAHIEREDIGLGQHLGDVAFDDLAREPFGNRGLAHAGFSDQQRIVLAAAAEGLDHALQFLVAPDQRVDLALQGQGVEVDRVLLERAGFILFAGFALGLRLRRGLLLRYLADAMRDVIHDIQPGDPLFLQEIDRMRVFFAVNGDQHVGTIDFLFARRLNVQDGTLNHPLEAQGRLRVDVVFTGDAGRVLIDEFAEILPQQVNFGTAGTQGVGSRGIVQQGQQQVLDRDEFVAFLARLDEGHVQADFEFLGNHQFSSMMHASGCWCWRANALTCSTLVAAMSRGKTPHTPRPSL